MLISDDPTLLTSELAEASGSQARRLAGGRRLWPCGLSPAGRTAPVLEVTTAEPSLSKPSVAIALGRCRPPSVFIVFYLVYIAD